MFGSSRNETIISTEQTRLLPDNADHDVVSLIHPETRISSDYNWRSVVASKLQGVPGMFLLAAMLLMGLALASHSATASIGGHNSHLRGTKYSMVSSVWAGRQSEDEDFVTVSPTIAPTSEPTQMSTMTTSPTFSPSILASTTSTTTNSPTSIVVPTSVPTNTATSVPTSTTETFSPTSFVESSISTESDESSTYETQSIPEIGDLQSDTNTAEVSSIDTLFPSSTPGDAEQDDLPENQIDFTNVKNETNSNTVEGNSTNDVPIPTGALLQPWTPQTDIENESTAQELLPQSANATQTIPEPTDIGDLPSETNTAETANIDTLFPSSTPGDADRDDEPKNQIDFTTTVEDETDANTLKANSTNDVPIPIEEDVLQPLTPQMEVEMSGESTTQELSPEFDNGIGKDDDQGQVTEEAFSNDAQDELVDKVLVEPTIELEDGIESHDTVVDELTFINDTSTANDIEENTTSDSMTIDVEEAEDDSFPETSQAETRHVDFNMDSFDESNDAARDVDADSVDSISEDIKDALQTEEPTFAPTLTPTISSETADLLFAGSLIDDKGFFFPMSLPSKESQKTTHNHHKKHGEITGPSDERNSWDESWDKTNSKDLAAVAEYYHVKGKWLETIYEQNSEKGKNSKVNQRHHNTKHHQTRSLTRDWEEDPGRGLKMSQIFLTIANTIDNHYESSGRNGEQAAAWVDDQSRGRKLSRLYHELASLIADHYDEEQNLDESGTKSSSHSYMVQGLEVSKYYEEKSSEMEEYLNRKNTFGNHSKDFHDAGVKQFHDDDYSQSTALQQLREDQGKSVHNYFRAVYDTSYKQELQSKLPDHYPDKDFPRWGRDWRADRDHGIAIGNYWKQYHDVMKTYYEEQGNKLRKLYTEFYTQRFH
ncbi:hypothetical protein IV203_017231 [Nitzschia inconspicua]|uniref:Uncharacterized protein n=1 Tax=Nitzschia inconspicua TaxID=303405 RepID=A0A9K3KS49_9STRA|nr:hypothetical protein IV203_017231 [Nitzschia inconspicua]